MGKIGIITCGKEANYGACLQALATQHKIAELGYDVEIMNYSFLDERSYSPLHQKKLRSFMACILFYPLRKSLHVAFNRFREKYMKYSGIPLSTYQDFQNIYREYDAFLIGSDQVWNPNLGIDTDITLLRFYDEGPKRISYSSSFGIKSLPDQLHGIFTDALNKFSHISTREVAGKQIVYDLTGRESVVSLDPTMLLDECEWNQYEEEYEYHKPYVLIYDMRHSPAMIKIAKKLAENKGCHILALSKIIIQDSKIRTLYGISPGQYLSLIKHAEAIVTDSFHGTVFSIIYNKEFYSYCSRQGMSIGGRLTNILDAIGLTERLVFDNSDVVFSEINYNNVNERLKKMRTISMTYLKKALSDDEVTQEDCITRVYYQRG